MSRDRAARCTKKNKTLKPTMTGYFPTRYSSRRSSSGFTLAEILAFLFLLSSMFLISGVSDNSAARNLQSDQYTYKAHHIAQKMASRIQANVAGLRQGAYYIGEKKIDPAADCTIKHCTPSDLAASDIAELSQLARNTLPSAQLQIGKVFGRVVQVRLLWSKQQRVPLDADCVSLGSSETGCAIVNLEIAGYTLPN